MPIIVVKSSEVFDYYKVLFNITLEMFLAYFSKHASFLFFVVTVSFKKCAGNEHLKRSLVDIIELHTKTNINFQRSLSKDKVI